jgi:hypothetical protein
MLEGMDDVVCTGDDKINGGGGGHGNMLRKPGDGVGRAFALGFPHPDAVPTIIVKGRADIPAVKGVRRPGATERWFLVDEDTGAGRRERCAVEVKLTVDLCPSGEFRVDARGTHEVEGEDGLRKEAVPEVERKIAVGAAEAGDEVVLERADGAFGGVGTVDAGGD